MSTPAPTAVSPAPTPTAAPPPRLGGGFLETLLRGVGAFLARCLYRVRPRGLENLPRTGGALLLPNHVTWVDAIVLQLACPRRLRFLIYEPIYNRPVLRPFLKLLGCIPIMPGRAKGALSAAAAALRAGEVICIYPEGELTRTGTLLRLKKGYLHLAREADVPVVPVWLDQLWGSIFSYEGGRYFSKLPRRWPYPVTVAFGEKMTAGEADTATLRERMLGLGADCYSERPALRGNLAEACLRGLKHGQRKVAVVDGNDGSQLTRGTLLAAGITLARYLQTGPTKDEPRIAIVLPPGKGAMLANLAVALAGKVPVNLNFTAGRAATESALRQADIRTVLSARLVQKKLESFPWEAVERTMNLEELLPPMKRTIALWRIAVALLPWRVLTGVLGTSKRGDHDEAVLLFTSGTGGNPKGVVLSHRNVLANVSQFRLMVNFYPNDAFMASLPFFHSFGCTVTLWFPLIEGVKIVTYPSPLDVGKNAELIQKHRCTVHLATPTFLRSYLRKATREQLASLRLVIVGAEKLTLGTAQAFEEKFGHPAMEGYGLTEMAPVVAVNLPDIAAGLLPDGGRAYQPGRRLGSVGKIAPGIAVRVTDPDTGERRSLHETGMLWYRGPNVFEGYFGEPEQTAKVKTADGWFRTGDLGRVDEDGFLFIEGRVSRFSKIAGEMVPHESVETKVQEALGLPADGERAVVVVGVPDEAKGEALVLIAAVDVDLPALRQKLTADGVPNLWVPRTVRRVESLPMLGTGKLDLGGCRRLALEEAV